MCKKMVLIRKLTPWMHFYKKNNNPKSYRKEHNDKRFKKYSNSEFLFWEKLFGNAVRTKGKLFSVITNMCNFWRHNIVINM